jgi:hypothetical protein
LQRAKADDKLAVIAERPEMVRGKACDTEFGVDRAANWQPAFGRARE